MKDPQLRARRIACAEASAEVSAIAERLVSRTVRQPAQLENWTLLVQSSRGLVVLTDEPTDSPGSDPAAVLSRAYAARDAIAAAITRIEEQSSS